MLKKIDWTKPIESTLAGIPARFLGVLLGCERVAVAIFNRKGDKEDVYSLDEYGWASGSSGPLVRNVPPKPREWEIVLHPIGEFYRNQAGYVYDKGKVPQGFNGSSYTVVKVREVLGNV